MRKKGWFFLQSLFLITAHKLPADAQCLLCVTGTSASAHLLFLSWVTFEDLQRTFGDRVARLVETETENKRPNIPASQTWEIRKRETIDHYCLFPILPCMCIGSVCIRLVQPLVHSLNRRKKGWFFLQSLFLITAHKLPADAYRNSNIGNDESKVKKAMENVVNEMKAEQGVCRNPALHTPSETSPDT